MTTPKITATETLVLRVAHTWQGYSVLDQHLAQARTKGHVAFAKIGKPIGRVIVAMLNGASRQRKPVPVLLVASDRKVLRAVVERAYQRFDKSLGPFMPDYYDLPEMRKIASTWLLLGNVAKRPPLERGEFVIKRSGNELLDTLDRSIASVFIATEIMREDTSKARSRA